MVKKKIAIKDDDHFSVGPAHFRYLQPHHRERTTTAAEILILKHLPFLIQYDHIFASSPNKNVVEMGIAEGGSIIFFALRHPKHKFVGIDLRKSNPEVQKQIDRLGLSDRVKLYYGVDQADSVRVPEILNEEFGTEEIGVFMDDASHLYRPSRATFENTFLRVAAGGYYCLEDWGWAHELAYQARDHPWRKESALSNLVFDIARLMKSVPNLIQHIDVTPSVAFIQRGPRRSDAINLSAQNLNRGRLSAFS